MCKLFIAIILLNIGFIQNIQAREFNLVTAPFAPFTDPDHETGGFLVELARHALKSRGHQITVEYKPWARALKEAADAKYDGLLSAFYNEERAKSFYFSAPLNTTKMVFVSHRDHLSRNTYSSLSELIPYRITVGIKWAYSEEFENHPDLQKQTVKDEETGIKLLFNQRTDLFAVNIDQFRYHIKNMDGFDVRKTNILSPAISQNDQHIAAPISEADSLYFLSEFNTGFASLKANGQYEEIYNRHFSQVR